MIGQDGYTNNSVLQRGNGRVQAWGQGIGRRSALKGDGDGTVPWWQDVEVMPQHKAEGC